MSILLIGGTSRSLSPLSPKLRDAGVPCIITSRRGADAARPGIRAVKFEWEDQSTWDAAFDAGNVKGVVMTAPLTNEPAVHMNPFIDFAKAKGATRFALIGGLTVEKGGPWLGQVWAHLAQAGVEFSIVKPIWFMDNLLGSPHIETIRDEHRIYSGSGNGIAPWIAADDIAQVLFHIMTAQQAPEESYRIVGPRAVSMSEIAATISDATGQKIEYVSLTDEENETHLKATKMPAPTVPLTIWLEQGTRAGKFDYKGPNDVERLIGRPPTDLVQWVETNKSGWFGDRS